MNNGRGHSLIGDLRSALALGARRDPPSSRSGTRWLLGWALICAGIGLTLYVADGYQAAFLYLNRLSTALPPVLWQCLTVLGDERVALVLALLLARRHPRVFWTLVCAALVATAYSNGLKPLIDAARPPAVLGTDAFRLIGKRLRSQSFPSGHSVTAGVFFGVLIYYAQRTSWRLGFVLLATLVGLSRVAVGVHWPVDVMAGLAGGALAALAGAWLARRGTWGIYDEGVHLAFVALAGFAAVGVLLDDGGYPGAAPFLKLLAVIALAHVLTSYLLLPIAQRRRSRDPPA